MRLTYECCRAGPGPSCAGPERTGRGGGGGGGGGQSSGRPSSREAACAGSERARGRAHDDLINASSVTSKESPLMFCAASQDKQRKRRELLSDIEVNRGVSRVSRATTGGGTNRPRHLRRAPLLTLAPCAPQRGPSCIHSAQDVSRGSVPSKQTPLG